MEIDVILITYNREKAIVRTLEKLREQCGTVNRIIVVDNASTDGTRSVVEGFSAGIPNLKIVSSGSNLGVSGGRNLGIRESEAEAMVFLDDDADFASPGFAERIKEGFARDPKIGAIACKVVDGATGRVRPNEIPHRNKTRLDPSRESDVAYFIGAGHAIRRSALKDVIAYPEGFFYSQEEIFLSYRIIKAGYRIVYFPDLEVLHWQAQTGRVVPRAKWVLLLRNTLLVNYAFLPWPLFTLSIPVWTLKVLIRGGARAAISGLAGFRRALGARMVARQALSYPEAFGIWKVGGRILW